jgi:hypothetical protein
MATLVIVVVTAAGVCENDIGSYITMVAGAVVVAVPVELIAVEVTAWGRDSSDDNNCAGGEHVPLLNYLLYSRGGLNWRDQIVRSLPIRRGAY